jgi:glycerophosphoryl diester phosphodiesterase
MIKANFKTYATYVTDSLNQWDLNQVLQVTGLNLTTVPEVHFSNANTDRAIVRQATMANQVVSVGVPNSLLQDPLRIYAHIGIYEGDTFKVVELVEIPVNPRKRPADYQIQTDDEEVYSFKQLENALANRATKAETNALSARIDTIVANKNNTNGNSELVDMRVGADGTTYASAGAAVRGQVNTLTRRRTSLATLLPSSRGILPRISTAEKTLVFGEDTLIINDRLPNGYVSLTAASGNNSVVWGSEVGSSAICFYYDITNNRIIAQNYYKYAASDNLLLLCALRNITGAASAVCSLPIYVDDILSTESTDAIPTSFGALLPPLDQTNWKLYPEIDTTAKTFTIAEDTLLMDNRLPGGYVSLKAASGNTLASWSDYATSAVCIYYDISNNKLIAKAYSETMHPQKYILVAAIRCTSNGTVKMAYACCPVLIDGKLSTETYDLSDTFKNTNVRAVNHRGYNVEAPENTLAAFKLSKKKGFDEVECDVAFTADGVAVLIHDDTVDRTSNGTGNVSAMTFEAVRALDFGSWKSAAYVGTIIPTFEEFIALCRSIGLRPYVELKAGTEEQVKGLVDTVTRYGMRDKTTWIAFDAARLAHIKNKDGHARLGFIVGEVTGDIIATAQSLQTGHNEVFIDCAAGGAAAGADLCAEAIIPLEVWTVNDESAIKTLDPYVSGVTSDNLVAGRVLYAANID